MCTDPAPDADAPSLPLAVRVDAAPLGLHLRVEEALVRVPETLAKLALVTRQELSGPPPLLVVHWAAAVAQWAARVVLAAEVVGLEKGRGWERN